MLVGFMASKHTGRRYTALSEDCEPLTFLHMEAEYIGFMVSIESEMRLLKHIRSCRGCKDKLTEIFTEARSPEDELDELFSTKLQEKLIGNPSMTDCPAKANYADADTFIEARIDWRLNKLGKILSDAELELAQVSEKIKEEKPTS